MHAWRCRSRDHGSAGPLGTGPLNDKSLCLIRHNVKPDKGFQVARLGFEPRLKESESFVLPLHYRAVSATFPPPAKRGEGESSGFLRRSKAKFPFNLSQFVRSRNSRIGNN